MIVMWNIEKINELSEAEKVVFDRLKKRWVLDKYEQKGYKVHWKEIWWFKSKKTHNINFYTNKNGDLLFFVLWLIEDFWKWETEEEKLKTWKIEVDKILEKMWYKWERDQNWYYHMANLKTWKEVPQESLQYYEIFEILWNIKSREFWEELYSFEWDFKKRLEKDASIVFLVLPKEERKKYISKIEKNMVNKVKDMIYFHVLKPIELIFSEKHNIISKEQYNQLKDKVYNFDYIKKLIENPVWDYVEWKITTKKIQWKIYKLNTNQITEDELKLYFDLNIINKEECELLKDILEKRKLEQEKKEHIDKTRKHISGLERDVTRNLW